MVGAGAIVTKDVPAFAVVVGNPARVVRMLDAEDGVTVLGPSPLSALDQSKD